MIARVPDAVSASAVHRRTGTFANSAFVTIPGLHRITTSTFTRVFARYGAALRPGNAGGGRARQSAPIAG